MKQNMNRKKDRVFKTAFSIILFMLVLTGFAQMPIFKRYYLPN